MNARILATVVVLLVACSVVIAQESIEYLDEVKPDPNSKPLLVDVPRVLNEVTVRAVLASVLRQSAPGYDAFTLDSTNVTPNSIRAKFPAYATAERLGWLELKENTSGGTDFILTEKGRRLFEEKPTAETFRSPKGSYVFQANRPAFRRIEGIRELQDGTAIVEYYWRWEPTAVVQTTRAPSADIRGKAAFLKYEDGWRLQMGNTVAVVYKPYPSRSKLRNR